MHKREKSLATVVAQETALVVAISMGIYAVFQYVTLPDETISGLILRHGWHVVAIGALTYLILNLILIRKILRPVRELYLKFYAAGKGDFSPIDLDSDIRELNHIADGMNLMLAKMDASARRVSLPDLSSASREIRCAVRESENLELPIRERLMSVAERIETAAASLGFTSVKEESES